MISRDAVIEAHTEAVLDFSGRSLATRQIPQDLQQWDLVVSVVTECVHWQFPDTISSCLPSHLHGAHPCQPSGAFVVPVVYLRRVNQFEQLPSLAKQAELVTKVDPIAQPLVTRPAGATVQEIPHGRDLSIQDGISAWGCHRGLDRAEPARREWRKPGARSAA